MDRFEYTLEIELLSDTTFGCGEGVIGAIDAEIQQDSAGLPTLSGRAVKGMLVNECAELLYVLPPSTNANWQSAARRLFGEPGKILDADGNLTISRATVAPDLAAWVQYDVTQKKLTSTDVLLSLTQIRHQTAVDPISGAPMDETLRSIRVVPKGLKLYAALIFVQEPAPSDKALLAACVKAWRRAGLSRTRGRGKLKASITNTPLAPAEFAAFNAATRQDLTAAWFAPFKTEQEARRESL